MWRAITRAGARMTPVIAPPQSSVSRRQCWSRNGFTCRNLGVDSIGFSADRRAYLSNPYYRLRDAFATVRAWWDVKIARPEPVLGPKENIGL